jgi:hypothetical protein
MRPAASPASGQSPVLTRNPRPVRSNREEVRHARAIVFDATRSCCEGDAAVVTVEAPITRADIQAAFDEIDEKHHLVGIELHFERHDGALKAIFEPIEP